MSKVLIYVDGFNLYNRLLKTAGPGHKWLDIESMCQKLLSPSDSIVGIKYFSARISGRDDKDAPRRQQLYFQALDSRDNVKIYYGTFKNRKIRRPLVNPIPGHSKFQEVHTTEEKGSDVNLASHLVFDGCKDLYETAIVISNDTDLCEPIKLIRSLPNKNVGIFFPCQGHQELKTACAFSKHIRKSHVKQSQFPEQIHLPSGKVISKPSTW